jgi:putative oxidoreductase
MHSLRAFLGSHEDKFWAVFRIVTGLMLAQHGAQKLFGVLEGAMVYPNPLMVTAGIIEFGGGLLVAVGLQTVIAAFLASGEMAVAYFKVHASKGFWPILNGGEKAAMFCFAFLAIASRGAGIWSVDRMRKSRDA